MYFIFYILFEIFEYIKLFDVRTKSRIFPNYFTTLITLSVNRPFQWCEILAKPREIQDCSMYTAMNTCNVIEVILFVDSFDGNIHIILVIVSSPPPPPSIRGLGRYSGIGEGVGVRNFRDSRAGGTKQFKGVL